MSICSSECFKDLMTSITTITGKVYEVAPVQADEIQPGMALIENFNGRWMEPKVVESVHSRGTCLKDGVRYACFYRHNGPGSRISGSHRDDGKYFYQVISEVL